MVLLDYPLAARKVVMKAGSSVGMLGYLTALLLDKTKAAK